MEVKEKEQIGLVKRSKGELCQDSLVLQMFV